MNPGEKNIDIRKFRFTKSSINMLIDCPHAFYLRYIRGYPFETGYFLERGTEAHKLISKHNSGAEIRADELSSDMQTYLRNYQKITTKYDLRAPQHADLRMEHRCDDMVLGGELDAVYARHIDGGEKHVVVDYKTAASKLGKRKSPRLNTAEHLLKDYVLELQIYSYLFQRSYPDADVQRYGIFFLSDAVFLHLPHDSEYTVMHAALARVREVVEEGRYEPTRYQCSRCGGRSFCSAYLEGVLPPAAS